MPVKTKSTTQSGADNSRTLTKSRFNIGHECPTKLYYNDRPKEYGNDANDDAFLKNLAQGGFQVGALAKLYFPGGHDIVTLDKDTAIAETIHHLQRENVTIYEAAFRFENLFIRADIVKKVGNILFLYEVKAKSYHKDRSNFRQIRKPECLDTNWKPYLYDVAFQHYVIRSAFPQFKVEPYLYLANKGAVATVDGLNQRFLLATQGDRSRVNYDTRLSKKELGEEILIAVSVASEVEAIQLGKPNGDSAPDWPEQYTFAEWVSFLSTNYQKDQQVAPKISAECRDCQFRVDKGKYPGKQSGFEECWSKALALNSGAFEKRIPIFEIWKVGAPKLLADGVYFIDQLNEEDLKPKGKPKKEPKAGLTESDRKVLQWDRTLTEKNEAYFDKEGFLQETVGYQYPLHFIDFETVTVAIPFNKGMAPYEQTAFQFSHHLLHKSGKIEHKGQWINTEKGKFPNFEFVRQLKRQLETDKGSIFRYHIHENTVLNQIRTQLKAATIAEAPDKAELMAWIETIAKPTGDSVDKWEPSRPMVDLFDLVVRFFWHPRMGGSNSIKAVLPAMLEFSKPLQEKYSKPIYGGKGEIPSLNLPETTWVKMQDGKPTDPYKMLPKVFENWDRDHLDRLFSDDDLADGGAAMMAYAKMQFTEMSDAERTAITNALLRYCELDTLAMVMLWEGWTKA